MNFFKNFMNEVNLKKQYISILNKQIVYCNNENSFEIFKFGINDSVKETYNECNKFILYWECESIKMKGFVNFVPYKNIEVEHYNLCQEISDVEEDLIENQTDVITDISHWYPVFLFPNGDRFCYDDRNGKIVFYEHDVFDCGVNLHGLVIANSLNDLFDIWSKILFVDINDWYLGVDKNGINLNKEVYKPIFQILKNEK